MRLRDAWHERAYRRAIRRAFAQVMFYREQSAAAGHPLAEPVPTPLAELPQPPHSLVPYARPWLPSREAPLSTPDPAALARAMRIAGCRDRLPVLEIRDGLLDVTRLPGRLLSRRPRYGPAYRVLLSDAARVASPARRAALAREALAVAEAAGGSWLVASPAQLAAAAPAVTAAPAPLAVTPPPAAEPAPAATPLSPDPLIRAVAAFAAGAPVPAGLRWVRRLPIAAIGADPDAVASAGYPPAATVLHEPVLGYLGGLMPSCGHWHLDPGRVHARWRAGTLTISLPRSRRPVLLEIVPSSAEAVPDRCPRHGSPILRAASA